MSQTEHPAISPSPESAEINLEHAFTRVRGGGLGGSAWLAKIVGEHQQYMFERVFCRKDSSGLSGSGRSGSLSFEMLGPGLYEFRSFCVSSARNWEWSGFVLLREDGRRFNLPKASAKRYVQKHLKAKYD